MEASCFHLAFYLASYDSNGIDLVNRTALDIRRALLPVDASDTLVTKVMLGSSAASQHSTQFFKKGFGVAAFSRASLRQIGDFYRDNIRIIDQLRQPTLDFTACKPTTHLNTRAKTGVHDLSLDPV